MAKKETGLAVASQFSLENVPEMLEKVNAEIAKLKGDKDKAPVVTESLGAFGQVSNISDASVLRDAYAFITRKASAAEEFKAHFETLEGAAVGEFREKGHSLKVWQDAIDNQYRQITFGAKLAKLEAAKKLLVDNLSAEQKFQQSIADIADLFKA